MKTGKFVAVAIVLAVFNISCTSTPQVSGLISLEDAITGAAVAVEERAKRGDSIAVTKFDTPLPALSDFLSNGLNNRFNATKKLAVVVRGENLESVNAEHQFQMSGWVSDESLVGIGKYLGAKIVVVGDLTRFSNFSAIYIRAVDVETAQVLATYSSKIDNSDPIFAGITASLGQSKMGVMNEKALEHLNRGKEYIAAGLYNVAIGELTKALAVNRNIAEAYLNRGFAYWWQRESNQAYIYRAIADYTIAIDLDPNNARAYDLRGSAYNRVKNYDQAIADYTLAIRFYSDDNRQEKSLVYFHRAYIYDRRKDDLPRAIADYKMAVKIDPGNFMAPDNLKSVEEKAKKRGIIILEDGRGVIQRANP